MRIILASKGFTTDEIENAVAQIVGKLAKHINIAIINESAYVIDKDQSKRFWEERYNCKLEDFEYKDLGIVPFNIVPHYMSEKRKQWNGDFLKDVLSDNPFPVYAITDKQAVAYIDGKIEFIGGEPEVFGSTAN